MIRPEDVLRLIECIQCAQNPALCGCTEEDEDEAGRCKRYVSRETLRRAGRNTPEKRQN